MLFDKAIKLAIQPFLIKLAKEVGQEIKVNIIGKFDNDLVETEYVSPTYTGKGKSHGEVKVMFKEAFPERYRFTAEAVIYNLKPSSGYSGFVMKGRLVFNNGECEFGPLPGRNKYNFWGWQELTDF
ncbi:hypothetical protein Xcab_02557 [Xenorhabdus cabanillasii JM26]|nr:hypothetical protein Xcab_02557 [Xenorhabdus cabanillasii JM26]